MLKLKIFPTVRKQPGKQAYGMVFQMYHINTFQSIHTYIFMQKSTDVV